MFSILEEFRPGILVIPEYGEHRGPVRSARGLLAFISVQWKRYRPLVVLAADGWTLQQPDGLEPLVGGTILPATNRAKHCETLLRPT